MPTDPLYSVFTTLGTNVDTSGITTIDPWFQVMGGDLDCDYKVVSYCGEFAVRGLGCN
jgi:hypothetical protein